MNTLTIDSKAALTLARATERARAEKPLVRKTSEYGKYEVRSTTDKNLWYKVTCNSETKTMYPLKNPGYLKSRRNILAIQVV